MVEPITTTLLQDLLVRLRDVNVPVKTLVVLDQVEAIAQSSDWPWFQQFLEQWMEQGQGSRILVTTRSRILSQEPIALGGLNPAEAAVFFEREGLTGTGFAELNALAGGHPLLLKLAAAWTKETYGARVDDPAIDFFGKLFANYRGDPTKGVEAIFGVIFEELPIGLRDLLCGVSVYRLAFGVAMAQAIAADATIEDLELLAERGLLLRQGDGFTLHPLVADLVRSRVSEEVRVAGHEGAIGYYSANFQKWDGTIESCRAELEGFYHACELGQYGRAKKMLDSCQDMLYLTARWRLLFPLYERLTNEWQTIDDSEAENLGWSWIRLGNLNRSLGNYRSAIDPYVRAQTIFDQLGCTKGKACVLGNMGLVHCSLKQHQCAIEFYQQCLDISRTVGNRKDEAASLGNLGSAYELLSEYQHAIDYFHHCLDIAREIGDRMHEASSLSGLGLAYESLGQYQRAIDFHRQYNEIAQELGNPWAEGAALINMGQTLGKMNRQAEALRHYQQAKDIFTELQLDHMTEVCDTNIQSCQKEIAKSQRNRRLRSFLLWFSFGLTIAILIYWFKR